MGPKLLGTTVVSTIQERRDAATLRHAHLALLRSTAFLHGETGREILIPSPFELNKPLEPREKTWKSRVQNCFRESPNLPKVAISCAL